MGYSKIKSVSVKDFMGFKEGKISFDEENIINIKGYNDSGKSALLRAISVALFDNYKQKQVKFIRHGADYFRIIIEFDDGIVIIRDKYLNGQSLYEMRKVEEGKEEEILYTSKQGNKLARIQGVPQPIQDYLGLLITDKTCFNYQTCRDAMPVVEYTGSENYQVLHEALHLVELSTATNLINMDRNKKNGEIAELESDYNTYSVLLEKCKDVTKEFVEDLIERDKESDEIESRKNSVSKISSGLNSLVGIKNIPEIEKVDIGQLKDIEGISNLYSNLSGVKTYPELGKLDTLRMKSLNTIYSALKGINGLPEVPEVPKITEDNVSRLKGLGSITKVFNSLSSVIKECKKTDDELSSVSSKLESLVLEAEKKGIRFIRCNNCGTYSSVDVGGHSHE